jgi:menaquinone-dependent protoporphyrinogen oxidase
MAGTSPDGNLTVVAATDRSRMPRVLVVYASTHGNTGQIAARIAKSMRRAGHHTDLREVGDVGDTDPGAYELVVVGASIHIGKHLPDIAELVERHAAALNAVPSAFFSVSLTAAQDAAAARETAAGMARQFELATGWTPRRTATFAGALQYSQYGFLTKRLIRRIAKSKGQSGDTGSDVELTDWKTVERFAADVASMAGESRAPTGPKSPEPSVAA